MTNDDVSVQSDNRHCPDATATCRDAHHPEELTKHVSVIIERTFGENTDDGEYVDEGAHKEVRHCKVYNEDITKYHQFLVYEDTTDDQCVADYTG